MRINGINTIQNYKQIRKNKSANQINFSSNSYLESTLSHSKDRGEGATGYVIPRAQDYRFKSLKDNLTEQIRKQASKYGSDYTNSSLSEGQEEVLHYIAGCKNYELLKGLLKDEKFPLCICSKTEYNNKGQAVINPINKAEANRVKKGLKMYQRHCNSQKNYYFPAGALEGIKYLNPETNTDLFQYILDNPDMVVSKYTNGNKYFTEHQVTEMLKRSSGNFAMANKILDSLVQYNKGEKTRNEVMDVVYELTPNSP